METIKDRLAHILRAKNLTASQFAEMMEIQPSNVSHLLNGRNNPSLDFLIKLKEVFPEYSFDWIILGKKPITINDPSPIVNDNEQMQFEYEEKQKVVEFDDTDEPEEALKPAREIEVNNLDRKTDNSISKMIIVYSDNSFEIIYPR